VKLIER